MTVLVYFVSLSLFQQREGAGLSPSSIPCSTGKGARLPCPAGSLDVILLQHPDVLVPVHRMRRATMGQADPNLTGLED